ncbi:hypothetical protein E2R68_05015 [Psychromonas sp. RZ22]|uniref:asparagine synthase-related protein n=1 Tax=Psychromonas algarum TaxID=2555643 RepID=UPI001068C68B|nr:asparagine synthase-related protein [Psychromonas sp. RZ22]TEW55738.1 hypothetical protein E2R68_05015 [Psychromonas sp. RZ22]
MKVVINLNLKITNYECIEDFLSDSHLSDFFKVNDGVISILFTSLQHRFFMLFKDKTLIISDSLIFLSANYMVKTSEDANSFYSKFGFIFPPFTQYEDVYLIAPYIEFTISDDNLSFKNKLPERERENDEIKLENVLNDYFNAFENNSLNVLVSGGIDSSALLGLLNENKRVGSTFMCKMSSLPAEGELAAELSDSASIPFRLIDLDLDLSDRADEFVSETGEYIADSIALVFPELFSSLNCTKKDNLYLVDGQGADSLLNGLPLNKIYNFWNKLHLLRPLLKPLSWVPIYKDKSTPFKRKAYRITKAVNCLAQSDFRISILTAMIEKEGMPSKIESYFLDELEKFYRHFNDWHLVIRFLYMFRVLPAREMQKYLFAKKYNITMVAPFLEPKVIQTLLFMSNESSIKDGLYKYPITKLAQKYWPGHFEKSKTSPFQVNYSVGCGDLKNYSLKFFSENPK